ncbi:MAG: molybdopterin-dependent oxidoreductase [Pseudomonadota bacterium]
MAQSHDQEIVSLTVNGKAVEVVCDPRDTLLSVLRERIGLTSVREGCLSAQCGNCIARLDGQTVKTCSILAAQAQKSSVVTIEGLAGDNIYAALSAGFKAEHGLQCGYCTPGVLMNVHELLSEGRVPDQDEVRRRLRGNLCRCTGYENIVRSVIHAAKILASDALGEAGDDVVNERYGIGVSLERVEDSRLLAGQGRFTDDSAHRDQLHAVFVRSSIAFGDIEELDCSRAMAVQGVRAVFTAQHLARDSLGTPACSWNVMDVSGEAMRAVSRPLLATGSVHYVGQPIAMVIADTRAVAERAARQVNVRYQARVSNVDPARAESCEPMHEGLNRNIAFHWQIGDLASVESARDAARHSVTLALKNNRVTAAPMETRAANGQFDKSSGRFTLRVTTQNPHIVRRVLSEEVGLAPESRIDVISEDVGGSFGSKIFVYGEECLVLWAARELGSAVKWRATRREAFAADVHGRDHVTQASLILDDEGVFQAVEVKTIANLGAFLSPFGSLVPTFNYGMMLVGPYTIPSFFCDVKGVYTNTSPVDAYRGAGRPEATFVLESLIDQAAKELGLDAAEIRRRNLIPKEQIPYQPPNGLVYDSGDFLAHFEKALAHSGYEGFMARRRESEGAGKRRGIGLANYVEACGIGPSAIAGVLGAEYGLWEAATLRFTPTGTLEILTGSHAHGQGHETTFAQIAHEELGVAFENIVVVHGDTRRTPVGMGSYGSRSLVVGGSAVIVAARKLVEKGRTIAAYMLDCHASALNFEHGVYRNAESQQHVGLEDVILAAYAPHDYPEDLEPGMEATSFYDPVNFTYPSGTHVCEVEIDIDTGRVQVTSYTAVDDFGVVVNPAIVDGQLHGGIAQGIGQALREEVRYDPNSGELITDSFWNYAMPRAENLPSFNVSRTETHCLHNPVGAKGCGESGAIAAPPAVINAIANAIGCRVDMPATPERVWRAIRANEENLS